MNWYFFQSDYIEKILDKLFKGDNSIVKIPMDLSIYLSKNKDNRINQLEYSWIIKSLISVMLFT
jgi:hypothetical protein